MPAVLFRPAARRAVAVAATTTALMGSALTPTARVTAQAPRPVTVAVMCPVAAALAVTYIHPLTSSPTPIRTSGPVPKLPPKPTCPGPNV